MLDHSDTLHLRGLLRSLREAAEEISPVSYASVHLMDEEGALPGETPWCAYVVFKPVRVDSETLRKPRSIAARAGDLGAALDLARVMIAERAPAPRTLPPRRCGNLAGRG